MPGAPSLHIDPPRMSPFAREVYAVLAQHTAFPWPILRTQCRRRGLLAQTLTPAGLGLVLQELAMGVARFNDVQAGMRARHDLVTLMRQSR